MIGGRFPVPVESVMGLLALWDACAGVDPLAEPLEARQRRRRELIAIRRDEADPLERERQRRARERERQREKRRKERDRLAALVLGARLAGAACA